MKLCMCCLEELFDKDNICYKCNSDRLIGGKEFQQIQLELKSAKQKERDRLIKIPKYKCVGDYLLAKQKRDENRPEVLQYAEIPRDINPSYAKTNPQPSTPTITCPYCRSTNTKKISGLSKAVSVGIFGIFALGKTTKQFHCNNCKADF